MKKIDWKKIGIGSLIAGSGAILTYLGQFATNTTFGVYTPIVVAVLSVLTNIVRKYAQQESSSDQAN